MNTTCNLREAYDLMMEGSLALGEISQNGIRVDVSYCERQQRLLERKIEELERNVQESDEVKLWKNVYVDNFNLDSPKQLADILYNHMKLTPPKMTEKDNPSVDKASLESLDVPFIKDLLEAKKLKKLKNTYLLNIIRETVDGYMHPFFNLHLVQTFRSSSDHVNWQNLPIRDKDAGKIIRSAILPREGNMIIGCDYSGIEVRTAYWYHKDPVMGKYLSDPTKDMHRDMAMEIYMLTLDEVTKDARFAAKNGFVFAEFYGDYYKNCAKILWNFISSLNLKIKDTDVSIKKHLRDKGIRNYAQFEAHLQKVEDRFWNEKFTKYQEWKDIHYNNYKRNGYVDLLTGFRCSGVMSKNQVINFPVQGVAFHCLLWSLIKIHNTLKREGWKSKIIGQIHDELVADVHPDERDDYLVLVNRVMCHDIREHWPWITTKLDIEATSTPIDGNWYLKKEVPIPEYVLRRA